MSALPPHRSLLRPMVLDGLPRVLSLILEELLFLLSDPLQDLLGGRVHVDVPPRHDPVAEVAMQAALELWQGLPQPADDQVLERPSLEQSQRALGHSIEVLVELLRQTSGLERRVTTRS
jgi:hypothetical protein